MKPNDRALVASGQPRYKSQTFSAKKKLSLSGMIAQNQEGQYYLTREGDLAARQAEKEKPQTASADVRPEAVGALKSLSTSEAQESEGEGRKRRWRNPVNP
jgi:hypothetical protein